MKQRILSVALALCLCVSSQSAVYAYQEAVLPQEDTFTEETGKETDTAGDETAVSQEKPPRQEDGLTGDNAEEPPRQGDGLTGENAEEILRQEDGLAEEAGDETDTAEDAAAVPQETDLQQEDVLTEENISRVAARDSVVPTPAQAYAAMIALKDQDAYKEGTTWTNDEPYSDSKGYYHWKGGTIDGVNISAVGCVAFAFILSDAAFGNLPARMYAAGGFSYEDIKAGDILRVSNDAHTVIVLEVNEAGVVVAEGNISTGDHKGKVHWGRAISREEVMKTASHYITRYPEGYIPPDDPDANVSIASGTLDGGLGWNLTKAGTLTVSGSGAMPDFAGAGERPWSSEAGQIRKIIIGDGVTSVGSCAFWNCEALSVEISGTVATIGSSAFRGSSLISAVIPAGVRTISDSAFRECENLSSVTVREGVETIEQNVFRACSSLASIALPASIGEVGAGAFMECTVMKSVTFASGSKQVKLGDNIFTRCYELTDVTLHAGIDCIGKGMFLDCIMLERVEIPQGAESIGERAFASCSRLTDVVIPDSVTTIGTAAFSKCPLTDIYFTGTEAQWNSITKLGDTVSAVSKATIHYNYIPPRPDTGGNGSNGTSSSSSSSAGNTGKKDGKTWEPATSDEIKRYACMGKEEVHYIQPKDNACQIVIENAMQGPLCFEAFEALLGDYTIGRTYNIYEPSDISYSMEEKIQFTIEIPSAIYKDDREYKMICVTEGGLPVMYDDLDTDPETVTIKTDKFYAYALVYRQKQNR